VHPPAERDVSENIGGYYQQDKDSCFLDLTSVFRIHARGAAE
jgi:hypothetical protein